MQKILVSYNFVLLITNQLLFLHYLNQDKMKLLKTIIFLGSLIFLSSCSVQQFAINTQTKPFENGGKVFGEKTKELTFKKSKDIHLLGINVKKSDAQSMAKELEASAYTIETKSNLLVEFLTFGMVDYKIVKVIKRKK